MHESLFDDLARALSEPMPRRRVLRLFGGIVVAAAIPGTAAAAGVSRRPSRRTGNCPAGQTYCQAALPTNYTCCDKYNPVCCSSPSAVLCCKEGCSCGRDSRNYPDCVDCPRCAKGYEECGEYGCCQPGTYCASTSKRVLCCRRGESGCGSRCCAKGLRCRNPKDGTCEECPKGKEACGKKCCPKGSYCCNPAKSICCSKRTGSCCNTGRTGKPQWTCCNDPASCAYEAEEDGTYKLKTASRTCCPPERTVPVGAVKTCCPPGYLSLGGKLVVPPGGKGGMCCRKDKICGSGKKVTCCSTGSATVPELEQICCNGECRNFNFDAENCGRCGNVCPPGTRCLNRVCK